MAKFIYECIDCSKHYLDSEVTYLCPACSASQKPLQPLSGVLKILYDYESIKKELDVEHLKRRRTTGIWRYHEIFPILEKSSIPPLMTGPTPLRPAHRLRRMLGLKGLYLKDDTGLPTGSFKDRASVLVVARAHEEKRNVIVAASTGNAASSVSGMCASVGMKCVILCPAKAPAAKLAQIVVYGAKLLPVNGTYDQAFDLSLEATRKFGWYSRNTAFNPMTVEGKKSAALEIWEDLKFQAPDKILIPTGDGVILAGVAKGFQELIELGLAEKMPQLIAVQASGSCAITTAFESGADEVAPHKNAQTIADSICVAAPRNGRWALKAVRESGGSAVTVTDEEILSAIALLGSAEGVFAEPAAAATIAALKKLVKEDKIKSDETVVALITGSGLKDVAAASRAAKIPEPVEPDINSISKALQSVL